MSTAAMHDVYELNLASSGKLKLRAKGRLAEDTDKSIFEACVLLHEAARIERRAVDALATCPDLTRLASAIEECWCFVEGLDPPLAAEAWGRILTEKEHVERQVAESMLARIEPRFTSAQQAFAREITSSPTLLAIRDARSITGLPKTQQNKARKELASILSRFPGTTSFWWMSYRLAEAASDRAGAWYALARARQLAPDNRRFEAMSLLVAAWALPRHEAEAHIAGVRGSLDRRGAEVCLMYALAELDLSRQASDKERALRLKRAGDAADAGMSQAQTPNLRTHLRAVQLLTNELVAGRVPTMEILYRAGLSEIAAMTEPNANVVELLTMRARRRAVSNDREAA